MLCADDWTCENWLEINSEEEVDVWIASEAGGARPLVGQVALGAAPGVAPRPCASPGRWTRLSPSSRTATATLRRPTTAFFRTLPRPPQQPTSGRLKIIASRPKRYHVYAIPRPVTEKRGGWKCFKNVWKLFIFVIREMIPFEFIGDHHSNPSLTCLFIVSQHQGSFTGVPVDPTCNILEDLNPRD